MANRWHCVGVGSFDSGTWLGEIAQVGISGIATPDTEPATNAINANLPAFDAEGVGTSGTTTHCSVSYGSEGLNAWVTSNQDGIAEAMWTYLNAVKAYQSSTFSWKEIRVSAFEVDGKVVNGASVYTITAPIAGSTTMNQSAQSAAVTTFVTGGRGPRNRGRLYMPNTACAITSTGLLPSAQITAMNNAAKSLVNTITALSAIQAAVVSATHQTYSSIISVKTGDEVDQQRRRRGARKEIYTTLAV